MRRTWDLPHKTRYTLPVFTGVPGVSELIHTVFCSHGSVCDVLTLPLMDERSCQCARTHRRDSDVVRLSVMLQDIAFISAGCCRRLAEMHVSVARDMMLRCDIAFIRLLKILFAAMLCVRRRRKKHRLVVVVEPTASSSKKYDASTLRRLRRHRENKKIVDERLITILAIYLQQNIKIPVAYLIIGWLVSTVGRTSVFGRRTDPVLASACSRRVTTMWVSRPL